MADETETRVLSSDGEWLELPGLRLTVVEGPDRGRDVTARRGLVRVGSSTDNDLVLTDGAVSRRHLEIRLRGDDVVVNDLGSTNGTRVDNVRIVEAILSPASMIRVGDTAIRATAVEEPVIVPLSARSRFGSLLGRSAAMREAFAILERAAPSEATVLISGETGTGKELAAEGVHAHSSRSEGPFVTIDCGAIASSLVESELFGHVRGAFTGAISDRRGVFEEADGGTLFLDEIGELPLELQPKLLRALEKREVRRVGASQAKKVNVRVIAATNRDLAIEVNGGNFREDLYFRLAVVEVKLPPLRARRDDVPMLVHHFIEHFAPGTEPMSESVISALSARSWPGNVRELRNAVERAMAMSGPGEEGSRQVSIDDGSAREAMQALFNQPIKDGLSRWSELYERAYLQHALHLTKWSVSGTARLAGVNRRYIQRLMKRHGLSSGAEASEEEED